MIPGSRRYTRTLGAVLGDESTAERQRTLMEKALGVEATGKPVFMQGSGLTVGAAPSTLLGMIVGATLGTTMAKNKFVGGLLGGLVGAAGVMLVGFMGKQGI